MPNKQASGQRPAGFCRMWDYFLKIFLKNLFPVDADEYAQ